MSKSPRYRRPLIEALEPRLLFSATADIAVFDDGNSDGQYLAAAAQDLDLLSIYNPDDIYSAVDTSSAGTVIFVDTSVDNYQALISDIKNNLNDQSAAIVHLDSAGDGITQISDYLAGVSSISALHVISHGGAGSVQLGSQVLNESTIGQYQHALNGWKNSLTENADILLYGCDVAANQSGLNLLRELSNFTGADVAASNDLTGNVARADWDLEARVGQIETAALFSIDQIMAWQGALAAPTVDGHIPNQTATENALYTYTFDINTFGDADGDTLTYSAQIPGGTPLPGWLEFDAATRTFSGTPSNGDVGNITIEVIASDGTDTIAEFFDLEVQNVGPTSVVYESSGSSTDTQIITAAVPFFQSFFHDNAAPTFTIDAIVLQLVKDPTAAAQTITVTLLEGAHNGTVVKSASIFSGDINTGLEWEEFDFSNTVLKDNQLYFIRIDSTSNDGQVKTAIHNANVYANGSFHSSTGAPDTDRDLAFQVSSGPNLNPDIVIPIPNQSATENVAFTFQFDENTFSDPDAGDTLTYTATLADGNSLPAWLHFDAATRTFSGTPDDGDVGTFSIKVTAIDGNGGVVDGTFDLLVSNVNDDPFLNVPLSDQNATEDSTFSYTFADNTFGDADVGTTLTYTAQLNGGGALPSWLSFNAATRTFSGMPLNANVGTVSIDVIANDGNGGTVTDTFNIVVANTNDAPTVANVIPNQNATEDSAFNFQFAENTFNDQDAASSLTYSAQLAGGGALPAWLSFDAATRTFSGTPANADVGTLSVRVTASDGVGGTVSDTFDITIANTNDAPTVANAIPDQTATENLLFNFSFASNTFNDQDVGTSLTYTAQLVGGGALPSWLIFDSATRTFSGTPSNADVGSIAIELIASDGSLSVSDFFNIDIGNTDQSPFLVAPIPNQNATEDTAFNFQFDINTFDDPDVGDTLTYAATMADGSALLPWLSFDPGTRTFSGTPANDDVGTISIRVTAADNDGGAVASDTFDIVIANTNDAPTIANAITDQNATEDSAFNFTFASNTFTDQDVGNTLTYSAQLAGGGALPSWLSFDEATRTFSGTPLNAHVGTVSIDVIANDGNGGSVTETFAIIVANTNDAPTVDNLINDQNATQNVAFNFQFDANTFSDIDGNTLTYSAQLVGGAALPAWLNFDSATRTFSGTPANGDVGTLSIAVIANDGNGGTVTEMFDVVVANANDAPTVVITPTDYNAFEQVAINLHGTGISVADVDGDALTITLTGTYANSNLAATVGTTGVVIVSGVNTNTLILSGTAAQLNELFAGNNGGTLTYRLLGDTPATSDTLIISASDGSLSGSDTATINITAVNDAPENTVPGAQVTNEDTALVFSADNGNQIHINDLDVGSGDLEVTLSVTNGTLTLATVTGLILTTGDGTADSSLVMRGTQVNINAALAALTFNPTANYTDLAVLTITTSDLGNSGNGGALTVSDNINITINASNDVPVVANAILNQNATEDSTFNFQFAANTFSDVDGDTLTYTAQLAGGGALPAWLSFDAATRTFSGTPLNAHVGTVSIDVIANDGNGGTVTDTFDITVENANDAPTVANAIGNQTATEDSAFNFQFAANSFADVDGDSLAYTAQLAGGGALPAWLSFDAATRTFSGTPSNAHVGTVSIDVIASDGHGGMVTDAFDITVENANDAPTIENAILNQNATEDSAFNFQFAANTFADVDGDTLTYTAQLAGGGALPAWLSFDAATRTFSGMPTHANIGTVSIDVIASDGNGEMVTDAFDITVENANDAPTVSNSIGDQTATEDSAFNFQFAANTFSDVDGDTLAYAAQLAGGGALPTWLSFDAATRTFSGTPTNSNVGTVSIDVIASDGNGGMVTDTFNITVANSNDAPTVANSIGDQTVTEDSAFNFQFAANTFADVDGDTLAYTAQLAGGGALPTWLSFDAATRTFSGTPLNAHVGTVSIDVIASDGNGGTVTDTFDITVENANDAPTVANSIGDQTVTEDSAFNFQFATNTFADVDGDALTYTAQLAGGGALPTWLSFDAATRTFSGTPTNGDVGNLSIQVIASDGSASAVAQFQLAVIDVNDAPLSNGIADIYLQAGAAPLQLNLQEVFHDLESGTALLWSLVENTNSAITTSVQIDTVTGVMTLTFSPQEGGSSLITLRAQDAAGAFVETEFRVTLTAEVIEVPVTPPVDPLPPTEVPIPPIEEPVPPVERPPVAVVPPVTPPVDSITPGVPEPLPSGGGAGAPTNPDVDESAFLNPTGTSDQSLIIESERIVNGLDDKSSRDIERAEEALRERYSLDSSLNAALSLSGLIAPDSGFAPWEAADFDTEVRRLRAQMDAALEEEQGRKALVAGVTFSLTTGLLIWSLRASSLLLTMMSMLPLWRGLDPLPILYEVNKKKKELEQQRKDREREDKNAKEVGYLFDHSQNKKPH